MMHRSIQKAKIEMTLEVLHCISCGVTFAVEEAYDYRKVQDNKVFFCPNGHAQNYGRNGEDVAFRQKDQDKEPDDYNDDDDPTLAADWWKKKKSTGNAPPTPPAPAPDREAQQKKIRELHELEQAEARNADKAAGSSPPIPPAPATGIPPTAGAAELVAAGHYRKDGRFIRCNHCEKYYSSEAWLSRHLRDRHNINIEGKA